MWWGKIVNVLRGKSVVKKKVKAKKVNSKLQTIVSLPEHHLS